MCFDGALQNQCSEYLTPHHVLSDVVQGRLDLRLTIPAGPPSRNIGQLSLASLLGR